MNTIVIIVILCGLCAWSTPPRDGYQLAFADEFDGQAVDMATWRLRRGGTNRDGNVCLDHGDLVIRFDQQDGRLQGGGVITNFGLGYGYYETRAKLFGGTGGLHSSFWTAGVPGNGHDLPRINQSIEIDFFEVDSNRPWSLPPNFHYWLGGHLVGWLDFTKGADGTTPLFKSLLKADDDYFVCGCEYLPDRCVWYLNGVKTAEYLDNDLTGRPNVWLTALAGYKHAGPADLTKLPGESRWDYFRFYTMAFKGENLTVNPSFDDNNRGYYATDPARMRRDAPASWCEDGDQDAINVSTDIVHTGTGSLQLGKAGEYACDAFQQLRHIANGAYAFTCFVRNEQGAAVEVYAGNRTAAVGRTGAEFVQVKLDGVQVTDGSVRYGIRAHGRDAVAYVDDVSFACLTGTAEFNRKVRPQFWRHFADDEDGIRCTKTGEWLGSSLRGYRSYACYSSTENAQIAWNIQVEEDGEYAAQVYRIVHPESLHQATCQVFVNDSLQATAYVDSTQGKPGWQTLVRIRVRKGDGVRIVMLRTPSAEDTGMKYIRADAARLLSASAPSTNEHSR